jgi:hypothetical protein
MEFIGDVRYEDGTVIPWAFSQKVYSSFIDELEHASKWRYSGETELIILNALASFEDCLVLEVEPDLNPIAVMDRSIANQPFASLVCQSLPTMDNIVVSVDEVSTTCGDPQRRNRSGRQQSDTFASAE